MCSASSSSFGHWDIGLVDRRDVKGDCKFEYYIEDGLECERIRTFTDETVGAELFNFEETLGIL